MMNPAGGFLLHMLLVSLTHSFTHSLTLIECHSIKNMVFPKIQRLLRINRNDSFEAWLGIHPNLNRGTTISLRGQELAEPSQAQPSPPKKNKPRSSCSCQNERKTRPEKGLHGEHLYKGFLESWNLSLMSGRCSLLVATSVWGKGYGKRLCRSRSWFCTTWMWCASKLRSGCNHNPVMIGSTPLLPFT